MNPITAQEIARQVSAQEAELAAMRREIARLRAAQTAQRRRATRTRLGAALATALFVALVPLSLLAANPFNDLNAGSVHNANIDAIFNAGITTGCVPNASYCPNDFVTREQMASFLARTAGLGSNPPVVNAAQLDGISANDYLHEGRAFTHRANASNIGAGAADNQTILDHPLTNARPEARLFVTRNHNPGGEGPSALNPHPIGVFYQDGKWRIFNEDSAAMPVNAAFNVLVVYLP